MRSSRSSDNPVFVGLVARAVAAAALLCGLVSACGVDDAGAYDNVIGDAGTTERGRGVGRYGVSKADVSGSDIDPNDAPWLYKVSYDGLTMTPDGQHLLIGRPRPGPHLGWAKPGLQLVAYHLGTGKVADLGIANAVRVNFAPDGATGWLLAPVEPQGTELWQIDVATLKIDKMMVFPERYTSLDVSPNGQALVLGNVPRDTIGGLLNPGTCLREISRNGQMLQVNGCAYSVVRPQTLAKHSYTAPFPLRDLDFVPGKEEMILTWSTLPTQGPNAQPRATVRFQSLLASASAAVAKDVEVPNCADELILAPAHGLALLAPTTCAADPISVIDINQRKFVTNLPGFGPVSLVGSHAVGFVPRSGLPQERQAEAKDPIAWIRVDLANLQWQVFPAGSEMPTYLPTPDGQHLLAWTANHWSELGLGSLANLRRIRVADGQTVPLDNPTIAPGPVTWLPDGSLLTLSAGLLFRIDPQAMTSNWLPLGALGPGLLRVLPGGKELLLGEVHRPWVHRLALAGGAPVPLPLELEGTLYSDAPPSFAQPTAHPGWDSVVVSLATETTQADCGNRGDSTAVKTIRLQTPAAQTGAWATWGTPLISSAPFGNCEPLGTVTSGPPWSLAGRALSVRFWPQTQADVDSWGSLTRTIQSGQRLALSLGGSASPGLCKGEKVCAGQAVALTFIPGFKPTPWPRQPKNVVIPAGTAEALLLVD